MPLMRQWVEITVGEDLLIPVVRELLDMAVDPNQVEVVHGDIGRVILAEVHLAEHWFQERLRRDTVDTVPLPEDDFVVSSATEVEPPTPAPEPIPEPVTEPVVVVPPAPLLAPLLAPPPLASAPPRPPVRRTTSTKPSASLNGEEK
jgi:hypothetical protein